MTALMPDALTTTDPRWELHETVEAIAAGDDWAGKVTAFWDLVSREAHDLAHPRPIFGCPGCPQSESCPLFGHSIEACEDPSGHDRVWREGEGSLLVGVAEYGRERGR